MNKLDLGIRNSPSYLTLKKKILNFITPRSNDVFNVSHPKGVTFLTLRRIGLSHLKEYKFKHSFLDTLNPNCICSSDIETLNLFFLHCPRFTNERFKGLSPTFLEKPTLVLHQYFFMVIHVFQLNLTRNLPKSS